jgi:hypothetical protein
MSPMADAESQTGDFRAYNKGAKHMRETIGFGFIGLVLLSAAGVVSVANAQGVETRGARLLEVTGLAGEVEVRTSPGADFNMAPPCASRAR